MRTYILLLFVFVGFTGSVLAQEGVRYTADYYFNRGIYPSIEHWKKDAPIKPQNIITDLDASSTKFFQLLFQQPSFRFPENNEIVYLKPDEIFGYSDGEHVFYKTNYKFEIIGSISVLKEVDLTDSYSSFIKPGESYEADRKEGTGKLYILDYETGAFFKCKPGKVKEIFKRDPALYEEYKDAKGGRREKIENFIKEYNYRHPIYFPEG
jgi:hypothetical protein